MTAERPVSTFIKREARYSLTKYELDETGPSTAKSGILMIYDIFGFFPQTLRGADILASGDESKQFKVFMPEWFEAADISQYPPDTAEKMTYITNFFAGPASPSRVLALIPSLMDAVKAAHPEITQWGIIGFCWGAKVAIPNSLLNLNVLSR
jgi:dienelactone hydrolase